MRIGHIYVRYDVDSAPAAAADTLGVAGSTASDASTPFEPPLTTAAARAEEGENRFVLLAAAARRSTPAAVAVAGAGAGPRLDLLSPCGEQTRTCRAGLFCDGGLCKQGCKSENNARGRSGRCTCKIDGDCLSGMCSCEDGQARCECRGHGATAHGVPMRFMWGLWDDRPLPDAVAALHAKWAKQCGYTKPSVRDRVEKRHSCGIVTGHNAMAMTPSSLHFVTLTARVRVRHRPS